MKIVSLDQVKALKIPFSLHSSFSLLSLSPSLTLPCPSAQALEHWARCAAAAARCPAAWPRAADPHPRSSAHAPQAADLPLPSRQACSAAPSTSTPRQALGDAPPSSPWRPNKPAVPCRAADHGQPSLPRATDATNPLAAPWHAIKAARRARHRQAARTAAAPFFCAQPPPHALTPPLSSRRTCARAHASRSSHLRPTPSPRTASAA